MSKPPFLPSVEVVELALRAQKLKTQRLDANSKNCPHSKDSLNKEQARFTLIERLFLAIGVLSLKYNSKILIMDGNHEFTSELKIRLVRSLHLVEDSEFCKQFLSRLGKEFYQWISFCNERYNYGLEFDRNNIYAIQTEVFRLPPLD